MMNEAVLADSLGVERAAPGTVPTGEIVQRVKEGVPIQALDRVAAAVAPTDRGFRSGLDAALGTMDLAIDANMGEDFLLPQAPPTRRDGWPDVNAEPR